MEKENMSAYDPTEYKGSIGPGIDICYATGGWIDILGQLDAPEDDMDQGEEPNKSSSPSV